MRVCNPDPDNVKLSSKRGRGLGCKISRMRDRNTTRNPKRIHAPLLELRLLGCFSALACGKPVVLRARKDRALLAYLALSSGRGCSRERLADILWGEVEGDARHSLRQSLSAISRAIAGAHPASARALQVDRDKVSLEPDCVVVDALRVRTLLQSKSALELEAGGQLHAGRLLEDLGRVSPHFDDWLVAEREQLAVEAINANRLLLDLHAAAGTPEKAIAAASRLVATDPFREEARLELIFLYAECGHTRAAIAQYEAYATLLREELGAQPGEAATQVHRLLLEGETPARRGRRANMPARMPPVPGAKDEPLRHAVLVLEQMPDCIVVTDLDGCIVGWNEWATRNFGYDKCEVLGRKPIFLYGPGADGRLTDELIAKALRHGRWSCVLRLFNKNGSSRLHQRTMLPLRDENARVVGVFGVTRPLTRPIPGR